MTTPDAELLRHLIQATEDLHQAVTELTIAVQVLTTQVAVRVITVGGDPPLPSMQQDER